MQKHAIFLIFFFLITYVFGQTKIDSLENKLACTKGKEKFEILYELARLHSLTNPEKSLEYINRAFEAAGETDDKDLYTKALNGLAIAHYILGNNMLAIKYFEELLSIYSAQYEKNPGDNVFSMQFADRLSNLGVSYKNIGENSRSLECYLKALELTEPIFNNSPEDMNVATGYINILNNIGILYMNMLGYDKSAGYLSKALDISRRFDSDCTIALCLNNLGLVNIKSGDYRQAEDNYLEAIEINKSIGDSVTIAGNYNNLGLIFEKQEKWGKALNYYNHSLAMSKRLGYNWGIANTLGNIGKVYFQINRFDKAQKNLQKALSVAIKTDNKNLIQKIYMYLYEMYNKKSDNAKALEYFLLYTQLKDSIFTKEKTSQIAEMEIKYETEKKEKEIITLHKDNEINQMRLSKKNILVYSLTIGIIAVFGFLILIFFQYKRRDKAYKNLVRKNLEIVKTESVIQEKYEDGNLFPYIPQDVYNDESILNTKNEILIKKLNKFMVKEKPYLFSNISLEEICKNLNTNRTYLSNLINEIYQMNFNAFINEFRIREARRFLSDKKYNHFSIEGIGEMVGFSSKSTFHKNFKKLIGVTPSYFRQNIY